MGKECGIRRAIGYWETFNAWWRGRLNTDGVRPCQNELEAWYAQNAEHVWSQEERPSLKEVRTHAKCLRSTEQVRTYFRKYRAAKRATSINSNKRASGSDSESDYGPESAVQSGLMGSSSQQDPGSASKPSRSTASQGDGTNTLSLVFGPAGTGLFLSGGGSVGHQAGDCSHLAGPLPHGGLPLSSQPTRSGTTKRTPYAKYTARALASSLGLPPRQPHSAAPTRPAAPLAHGHHQATPGSGLGPVVSFLNGLPQQSAAPTTSIGGGIMLKLPPLQRSGSASARLQTTPTKHSSLAPDPPPAKRHAGRASYSGPDHGCTDNSPVEPTASGCGEAGITAGHTTSLPPPMPRFPGPKPTRASSQPPPRAAAPHAGGLWPASQAHSDVGHAAARGAVPHGVPNRPGHQLPLSPTHAFFKAWNSGEGEELLFDANAIGDMDLPPITPSALEGLDLVLDLGVLGEHDVPDMSGMAQAQCPGRAAGEDKQQQSCGAGVSVQPLHEGLGQRARTSSACGGSLQGGGSEPQPAAAAAAGQAAAAPHDGERPAWEQQVHMGQNLQAGVHGHGPAGTAVPAGAPDVPMAGGVPYPHGYPYAPHPAYPYSYPPPQPTEQHGNDPNYPMPQHHPYGCHPYPYSYGPPPPGSYPYSYPYGGYDPYNPGWSMYPHMPYSAPYGGYDATGMMRPPMGPDQYPPYGYPPAMGPALAVGHAQPSAVPGAGPPEASSARVRAGATNPFAANAAGGMSGAPVGHAAPAAVMAEPLMPGRYVWEATCRPAKKEQEQMQQQEEWAGANDDTNTVVATAISHGALGPKRAATVMQDSMCSRGACYSQSVGVAQAVEPTATAEAPGRELVDECVESGGAEEAVAEAAGLQGAVPEVQPGLPQQQQSGGDFGGAAGAWDPVLAVPGGAALPSTPQGDAQDEAQALKRMEDAMPPPSTGHVPHGPSPAGMDWCNGYQQTTPAPAQQPWAYNGAPEPAYAALRSPPPSDLMPSAAKDYRPGSPICSFAFSPAPCITGHTLANIVAAGRNRGMASSPASIKVQPCLEQGPFSGSAGKGHCMGLPAGAGAETHSPAGGGEFLEATDVMATIRLTYPAAGAASVGVAQSQPDKVEQQAVASGGWADAHAVAVQQQEAGNDGVDLAGKAGAAVQPFGGEHEWMPLL